MRAPGPPGFTVVRDGAPAGALRGAVLAIGNFDGVHRGHQGLIRAAQAEAAALGAPVGVLTFEPHPREVFNPATPLFRLTPEHEKLRVLERLGLGGCVLRRFDRGLAALSARAFVEEVLLRDLDARGVVVGHDFHFGRAREGTPAVMTALAAEHGLACRVVPAVTDRGEAISSSAIRAALAAGEVDTANRLLGYRWFALGEVRHGEKRGRELGYPTANMRLPDACGLRHGIYAVRAALDGRLVESVASFGRRPTFDDGAPLLETHLFDFRGDLYGREIGIEFVGWLRGEERFASIADLVRQMDEDAREARERLAQPDGLASMLAEREPEPHIP